MAEYGQIICHWSATVVKEAPERALMSLSLIAEVGPRGMFASIDTIRLGNDANGVEVIYRVVGWDAHERALMLHRTSPPSVGTSEVKS